MPRPFHVVDVFAERRYAGNQLAVVRDSAGMDDAEMRAVARETNYSETTFVERVADDPAGPHRVRIFTPAGEIPFAGHPTLGTAHVLREVVDGTPDEVTLDLDVGRVPVRVARTDGRETSWMDQVAPEFGPTRDPERAAAALSLSPDRVREDWPVQVVSTGLPTTVVPLQDRDALVDATVDRSAYDALVGDGEAKNVLAWCPDPRDDANDYAVRVFAPAHGVPEDPATGSSNGCLAAYLHRHGGDPVDARVEQGYELDRPSLLFLRTAGSTETPQVSVGGRVVPVVRGELL